MTRETMYGYQSDSSFYNSPSGGRRFHLEAPLTPGWSLCGGVFLDIEFGRHPWDTLSEILRCKRCLKVQKSRESK